MTPYPGNPNYAVTEDGRVFRTKGGRGTKRPIPYELSPCVGGPGYASLYVGGTTVPVHRLVAETFLPRDDPRAEVAHNDGNRLNNHVSNLRWATRVENMADTHAHGTGHRGERNPGSVLSITEVRQIKALLSSHVLTQKEIAAQFGVCRQAVNDISTGRNWPHVS